MSRLGLFSHHTASTPAVPVRKMRKLLLESQFMPHNWNYAQYSLYVMVQKEMKHTGFTFWFLVLYFILHKLYNSDLFPQRALHCGIFKSNISYCSSTEWNAPCTNTEVTANVETAGRSRVRRSQQPVCVVKQRGQYERSCLPTTQRPPGISMEMISLPAREHEEGSAGVWI